SLVDQYAEENLMKRFNYKKVQSRYFFDSLEADFIKKHIRPFIDKRIYEVVEQITATGLPLYFKGELLERIKEEPLEMLEEFAETCFNFHKLPEETHYNLEITYQKQNLNLYKQQGFLLSAKPCVLVLNNKILRFNPEWDGMKLTPFFKKEYLVVPQRNEREFFKKFVLKSILLHPFKNKGFEVEIIEDAPIPVLKLENHWQHHMALGLFFKYDPNIVFHAKNPQKSTAYLTEENGVFAFRKVIRNPQLELKTAEKIKQLGMITADGPYFIFEKFHQQLYNEEKINVKEMLHGYIDWINQNTDTLKENGIVIENNFSDQNYITGKHDISFNIKTKPDWFDIYGMVKVQEFEFPFIQLKNNILNQNREYLLPNKSIFLIPEEWMSMYYDVFRFGDYGQDSLRIKKLHTGLMESSNFKDASLPELDFEVQGKEYELPGSFRASLRPYQKNGYNWMMFLKEKGFGGCLADDMGLGKTVQTIALLTKIHLDESTEYQADTLRKTHAQQLTLFEPEPTQITKTESSELSKASLIVMPLSLIHNWIHEIKKFAPGLKVMQHTGAARTQNISEFDQYHVVLTTYGIIRNDSEMLQKYTFQYIILDESQTIKNAHSKIYGAIKKLKAENCLVLSGTPIENSLRDLWTQFSFINPGMLNSYSFFQDYFVNRIEKQQNDEYIQKLQKLIHPFILRRTKEQVVKELPELSEKIQYCEMTEEQRKLYETKKSEVRNSILNLIEQGKEKKSGFLVLSGLTRLRIIANHPLMNDQNYTGGSGKYDEVIRNVEKILSEDHKVLIFSQFVKNLHLFRDHFAQKNWEYSLLTGGTSEKNRQMLIDQFKNQKNNRLFLISLKAGGLGLNLTDADYVFMLDPWWNPAVERQAINRAHRIGQDKNVFVYKFITRNTVEEKILTLQKKKSQLANLFINENNPLKSLSLKELKDLM
ncbi:MAG: DEAD/DEAH box helicase, partial [Bacteroidota bacterium]